MGRDQRPLVARYWMTRMLAMVCAALLAGCGGNANVQANSSNGSASGSVNFPGRGSLGALLSIVFLAGVSHDSNREMARSGQVPGSSHAPELDPSRRVMEHDCTKPIEDWSANLKCR